MDRAFGGRVSVDLREEERRRPHWYRLCSGSGLV